jgi:hypothetical protein
MTITYATPTANARLAATLTNPVPGQTVDGGSGNGLLVIGTSQLSGSTGILVVVPLQKPSFTISNKVATMVSVGPVNGSATGIAASAELRDSDNNTIIAGLSVSTSGANVNLGSTSITSGQPVDIKSGTITSP